jgi:hypothetical protein
MYGIYLIILLFIGLVATNDKHSTIGEKIVQGSFVGLCIICLTIYYIFC